MSINPEWEAGDLDSNWPCPTKYLVKSIVL